jgi:hypothetical protein
MGKYRLGIPEDLALSLCQRYGIRTFVETGTYKGGTTAWAAQCFEHVVSIEVHLPYYEAACTKFSDVGNVELVFGDSGDVLGDVLMRIPESVILWLDAHWCGSYELSVGRPLECPLMRELRFVRNGDLVMIDDARLFHSPPPRPHDPAQWPTMAEIVAALQDRVWFEHEDVLIFLPCGADYENSSDDKQ